MTRFSPARPGSLFSTASAPRTRSAWSKSSRPGRQPGQPIRAHADNVNPRFRSVHGHLTHDPRKGLSLVYGMDNLLSAGRFWVLSRRRSDTTKMVAVCNRHHVRLAILTPDSTGQGELAEEAVAGEKILAHFFPKLTIFS